MYLGVPLHDDATDRPEEKRLTLGEIEDAWLKAFSGRDEIVWKWNELRAALMGGES